MMDGSWIRTLLFEVTYLFCLKIICLDSISSSLKWNVFEIGFNFYFSTFNLKQSEGNENFIFSLKITCLGYN